MTAVSDRAVSEARSQVYALLAAAFDGDVDSLSAAMRADAFQRLAAAVPGAPAVDALDDDYDCEALRVGYDNLFVVPGPHYVPPFASAHATDPSAAFESDSVFRDGDRGELLGRPAAVAASTYERFGFVPTRGDDFPDSLPAMLEFASALASAGATATDPDERTALRQAQARFLGEQLGWVDAFADAVADVDGVEGVFADLATFTSAFVAHDRDQLAATVGADG